MAVTPKPDTGHGASVTFGTTSWAGKLEGIPTNLQMMRDEVDATYMATTGQREYVPGDLDAINDVVLDVLFEQGRGLPSNGTVAETITITFPLNPADGSVSAATLAGTGFIKGVSYPAMQTGTIMKGQITIKFDGYTGPTFTAAT